MDRDRRQARRVRAAFPYRAERSHRGGDYHGLGIVRRLGRRGIPVIVLDDERSISRYSRYAAEAMTVRELRREEDTVAALVELSRTRNVNGAVVYPTREETVATLSRHRDVLLEHYRIPTPAWTVTTWAWHKRNTYANAAEVGIPAPRTWRMEQRGGRGRRGRHPAVRDQARHQGALRPCDQAQGVASRYPS